jgi:hypothetical protein
MYTLCVVVGPSSEALGQCTLHTSQWHSTAVFNTIVQLDACCLNDVEPLELKQNSLH